MTDISDHITVALARDMVRAVSGGMRVLAVTGTSSLVAALLARQLGASELALAVGFGVLDGRPEPALTLGEFALGSGAATHGPAMETFAVLGRGRAGVVVSPAQLDGRSATNLSRIGGEEHPRVALPGSRGLPENNHSPSSVWYVLAEHSPRTLVPEVDFVSGAAPSPGHRRRLVTPLGVLDYESVSGWTLTALMPGVSTDDIRERTGFDVRTSSATDVPVCVATEYELELLSTADPHGLRRVEFADRDTARRISDEQAAREAAASAE